MIIEKVKLKALIVFFLYLKFMPESEGIQCGTYGFRCVDGKQCIGRWQFCDGTTQCRDGSDEQYRSFGLTYPNETTFCKRSKSRYCVVPSSHTSRSNLICEQKHGCNNDQFSCQDGITCIEPNFFCNGWNDCPDGSDEPYRNISLSYGNDTKFCRRKYRTYIDYICELPRELYSRTDLCEKSFECDDNEFTCADGSSCIPLVWFCTDGKANCRDGSDKRYLNYGFTYPKETTFCRARYGNYGRFCVVPSAHTSRTNLICKQKHGCNNDQFSCEDGITCIDLHFICDGYNDCPNKIDEIGDSSGIGRMCDPPDYLKYEQKCLLPNKFICESINNGTNEIACNDGIDECLCSDKFFVDSKCFRCLTSINNVIPLSKHCDGTIDCPDLSDECLCRPNTEVYQNIVWSEKLKPRLACASNTTTSYLSIGSICNGRDECTNGLDEQHCSIIARYGSSERSVSNSSKSYKCDLEEKYVTRCDRNPECRYNLLEEECQCPDNPKFCEYIRPYSSRPSLFRCETAHKRGYFSVFADWRGYLPGYEVCNGQLNCLGMEDEVSCPNRFYCGKDPLPNFSTTKLCDMVDDCEDGRDEVNCSHFYCTDGGSIKYLDTKKVCDGNQDCAEGSDECEPSCIKSAFSSEKSMIKHEGLTAFVSIFGLIAFAGNVIVTFLMIRLLLKLFTRKNGDNKATKLTTVLIMNLSISDLLVGIYILAIFVKTVEVEGKYCLVDREWRSSAACSFLGVLLVVGSEESVFTMVLITIMRMRIVLWPRSNLFLKPMFAFILSTWILSLVIALVPLIPSFEDYFVDSIWYRDNSIFTTIENKEVVNLTNWLSFYFKKENNSDIVVQNQTARPWRKLEELIKNIDPNLTVAQKFGFYSTHAVCLPTFLPDRENDTAWAYSLAMVLLNFIAFFVIAIGYGIMFKEATKPNRVIEENPNLKSKRDKQNKKMQRKLIRIVASDFFCWIPVSFMAFFQVAGVDIPPDAYLPIGLIIIPINSALNPFLYSDLPDIIWEKSAPIRIWIYRRCCLPVGNMYRGIRKNSESAAETENPTAIDSQQVTEMEVVERRRELLGKSK